MAASLVLAACSSGGNGDANAPFEVKGAPVNTTRVDAPKSYKFVPAVIEVSKGATVTWTNHDNFPHTVHPVTGSDTADKPLPIGKSTSITFNETGTIYYECSIHPTQMRGKVIVKP